MRQGILWTVGAPCGGCRGCGCPGHLPGLCCSPQKMTHRERAATSRTRGDKSRPPPTAAAAAGAAVAPGCLTEAEWLWLLAAERSDSDVGDILEELMGRVMDGCSRAHVAQQVRAQTPLWGDVGALWARRGLRAGSAASAACALHGGLGKGHPPPCRPVELHGAGRGGHGPQGGGRCLAGGRGAPAPGRRLLGTGLCARLSVPGQRRGETESKPHHGLERVPWGRVSLGPLVLAGHSPVRPPQGAGGAVTSWAEGGLGTSTPPARTSVPLCPLPSRSPQAGVEGRMPPWWMRLELPPRVPAMSPAPVTLCLCWHPPAQRQMTEPSLPGPPAETAPLPSVHRLGQPHAAQPGALPPAQPWGRDSVHCGHPTGTRRQVAWRVSPARCHRCRLPPAPAWP